MYVVRHETTKEIVAIRLCEDDANEIRSAREDWEELEVAWEDTLADVLLSEIKRIGKECVRITDFESGQEIVFRCNEKNEIVEIVMLNGLMTIEVDTVWPSYFNDALIINEKISIMTCTMEVF